MDDYDAYLVTIYSSSDGIVYPLTKRYSRWPHTEKQNDWMQPKRKGVETKRPRTWSTFSQPRMTSVQL